MLQGQAHLNPTMRDSRGTYALDELLKLKRAEKPSPEFWNKFENGLRIKQRRLLQRQPVENLGDEITIWHRFRNFSLLCGAATSCGVVGFVVMKMLSPDFVDTSAEEPSPVPAQEIAAVEASTLASPVEKSFEQPAYFEVARADVVVPNLAVNSEIADEPSQAIELASNRSAPASTLSSSYVLEIDSPFQTINIDETIAFNADENITSKLMEKYVHPLSDRGWKYTQLVSNQADPLNRVTAMALDSKLFSSDSRSEIKWNALTLRF